jgi:hypothetical protein
MALENSPVTPEAYSILPQDVPQTVVNLVLGQLHDEEAAMRFAQNVWAQLDERPETRHYISQLAFEIAPENLELRGRVVLGLLGFYAVLDGAQASRQFEASMAELNALPVEEHTRRRFFRRRSHEEKVNTHHVGLGAAMLALITFGHTHRKAGDV